MLVDFLGASFTKELANVCLETNASQCAQLLRRVKDANEYFNVDSVANKQKRDESNTRPQLMCDYPLNLSILIRGGKETNRDSPSSGERNGIGPSRRVAIFAGRRPVPCKGGSIILRI